MSRFMAVIVLSALSVPAAFPYSYDSLWLCVTPSLLLDLSTGPAVKTVRCGLEMYCFFEKREESTGMAERYGAMHSDAERPRLRTETPERNVPERNVPKRLSEDVDGTGKRQDDRKSFLDKVFGKEETTAPYGQTAKAWGKTGLGFFISYAISSADGRLVGGKAFHAKIGHDISFGASARRELEESLFLCLSAGADILFVPFFLSDGSKDTAKAVASCLGAVLDIGILWEFASISGIKSGIKARLLFPSSLAGPVSASIGEGLSGLSLLPYMGIGLSF